MNKNLRQGLILGSILLAVLLVAFTAQAAGYGTNRSVNVPYGDQSGYLMPGMGQAGAMMGRMMTIGMHRQFERGVGRHMMDFDQMPMQNWAGADGQFHDCPYLESQ